MKTNTFSTYRKSSNSIKFTRILDEYFKINAKYIKGFEYGDAIFGYTEMANVAAFSTAAWNLNYVSIVEYQDEKYKGKNLEKNKKGKYKNGRVDLYISDNDSEYICEAKQQFTSQDTVITTKVREKIFLAYDDVLRSTKNAKEEKLDGYALIFVPHLSKNRSKDKKAISAQINALKESAKHLYENGFVMTNRKLSQTDQHINLDGYGYYFPDKCIKNWSSNGDKNLIGLTVFFKRVA